MLVAFVITDSFLLDVKISGGFLCFFHMMIPTNLQALTWT